ncbi:hypothetical protein [Paenibacillus sp. CF384]|uniref:hypothetical protein n=1 Tax=Paenibacillus sp. CF384 TaxID=1884382 RepID=UPI00089B3008|nr:hypothetical protein [Paenibacillus sp. CF384]SDW12999.1 hypothetical protein SAMN05518855_1001357 [Paenibacillus sp. CF384]
MANGQNQVSKADVQSVALNKLPVAGAADTEFSAEEAAEVFQHNPASNQTAANVAANEAEDEE